MSVTISQPILNLTTLSRAKTWIGINNPASDTVLQMAVTSVSAQIMAYLERGSFVYREYFDWFDGQGNYVQATDRWPIIDVKQVIINDQIIPRSPMDASAGDTMATTPGWVLEVWDGLPPGGPQYIELIGYKFWRGRQNVYINYTAGYRTQDEPQVIKATSSTAGSMGQVTSHQHYGISIATDQILHADTKAPYVEVEADPAAGEYMANENVLGGYLFNNADVGNTVLVSYSWCPYAVEQVALEMINEVYQRRQRPGQHSRSLAGQETTTYDLSGLPAYAIDALQPFKSVIPL